MLDVPTFVPSHHVVGIVEYIHAFGKCPYCHQRFKEKPTAETMANHTSKCVKKLENEQNKTLSD